MNKICLLTLASISTSLTSAQAQKEIKKPNIIFIYADDLGYGDVGCYGAKGVKTPNIDKMAKNGLMLTDAHCSASTCTPSRFSLLTGKYAFRNDAAILPGDAPSLISTSTPTLPGMLQKEGYKTAVVGKWHLGLGNGSIDWNGTISPGPNELGFNYSFIIPATVDRVPCVFVENGKVAGLDPKDPIKVSYTEMIGDWPTGLSNPEMLKVKADPQHSNTIVNGISRIGYMTGGKAALWKEEDFPNLLLAKAKNFILQSKNSPFFLYLAYHDIHVPRMPNPRFVGKSTMGSRGDAIAQMDWCTGEVIKFLEKLKIEKNTIVVFSSDNGPVLDDGYFDNAEALVGDHKPAGPFRGGKYSVYEGGTRVPTIIYWPSVIKPGVSDAMFNHVDFYASFAALAGHKLQTDEAPDSYDLSSFLLGKSQEARKTMVEEAFVLSLRVGDWKFIMPGTKAPDWLKDKKIESGLGTEYQLYNLKDDIGEQKNLFQSNQAKGEELKNELQKIIDNGRSR